MTTSVQNAAQHKDFAKPDEVRTFDHGQVELVTFGDGEVGLFTLEPGWHWSEHVKPIVGTETCEHPHFQYVMAGTLHVQMTDGAEFDIGPGEVAQIPPGHDAWVVGDTAFVAVDWSGASDYAK
jgi:quercetin dioxygenase-like cupin family protein